MSDTPPPASEAPTIVESTNTTTLRPRISAVTGYSLGSHFPSDVASAAGEKTRLAPQLGQRVSPMPTSLRQAGQREGRVVPAIVGSSTPRGDRPRTSARE